MPLTTVTYPSDGVADVFAIPFPYILTEHVKVYVNGALTTSYAYLTPSSIKFTPPPAAGVVYIKRETPSDRQLTDYIDGGALTEETLDLQALQLFYVTQEAKDGLEASLTIDDADPTVWNGRGLTARNFMQPAQPNDLVTKWWAENAGGSFVNQASGHAANALIYRDAALNSQQAAAAHAASANTNAGIAQTAATNAASFASTAEQHKLAAQGSASASWQNALDAADAATAANTNAGLAANSATNSAASAASASTNAGIAQTAATNAQSHRDQAATEAAAAAASAAQAAQSAALDGAFGFDVQGTGRFGRDGLGGQFQYEVASAANPGYGVNFRKDTRFDYTGGSPGGVCSADHSAAQVGPNVANFVWNRLTILDNEAIAGENVADYAQANKRAAGPTWARVSEARDWTGTANPTLPLYGHEIDLAVNGPDGNGTRFMTQAVGWRHDGGGPDAEIAYGHWIGPSVADNGHVKFLNGLYYWGQNAFRVGINMVYADFEQAAIHLGDGHAILWDNVGDVAMAYDATNGSPTIFTNTVAGNAAKTALTLRHTANGSFATGMGTALDFEAETSSGNVVLGGRVIADAWNVTPGSEAFQFRWQLRQSGVLTDYMMLTAAGFTVKSPRFTYTGAPGTQQIMDTYGWNNLIGRQKWVLEANGTLALYEYDATGGSPNVTMLFGNQSSTQGVVVGSPAGGLKGYGSINCSAVYDDGTQVICYVLEQAMTGDIDTDKWGAKLAGTKVAERPAALKQAIASGFNPLDLAEYVAFWREHRHLPSFPHADAYDPAKNKWSGGEMTTALMETIELHAVHAAALLDRCTALEARLAAIEARG